jgi:DNA-binding ferritin-like protein
MPPEVTFEDFRRLVEMLQQTIAGMAGLAERVKALEDANQASYAAALALKSNQEQLFEAQKAQQEVNALLKESLDKLLRAIGNSTPIQ